MKKFTVTITETSVVRYTIEANSADEAKELFENCPERVEEDINHDMGYGYNGREIEVATASQNDDVDYTYEQMKGEK